MSWNFRIVRQPWRPNEDQLLSIVADAFLDDDMCEALELQDLHGRFTIDEHAVSDAYVDHAVEQLEGFEILEQQVIGTAKREIVLYRLTEPYIESEHPYSTWRANMAAKTTKKTAKKTEPEQPVMRQVKTEPFRAELLCDLDDEEIKTRGQKLARLQGNIKSAEDDAKTEAKQRKARIDEMKAQATKITGEINEGRALKMVDCERIFNYSTHSVIERRLDNGAEVDSRPMEQWQLQMELPVGAPENQDDPDDPDPED